MLIESFLWKTVTIVVDVELAFTDDCISQNAIELNKKPRQRCSFCIGCPVCIVEFQSYSSLTDTVSFLRLQLTSFTRSFIISALSHPLWVQLNARHENEGCKRGDSEFGSHDFWQTHQENLQHKSIFQYLSCDFQSWKEFLQIMSNHVFF